MTSNRLRGPHASRYARDPAAEARGREFFASILSGREPPLGLTRPNKLIPRANLEDTILAWDQYNFANCVVKRPSQFLAIQVANDIDCNK